MKEIVIISDLWGRRRSQWVNNFRELLPGSSEIQFYDACELGLIDLSEYSEDAIHSQFVDGGIDRAVEELIQRESVPKVYIGCSVGGAIAWKAALRGLKVERLVTVSSTRLRYETEKPNCPIDAFFGEFDTHKPGPEWFDRIALEQQTIPRGHHQIYKDRSLIRRFVGNLE